MPSLLDDYAGDNTLTNVGQNYLKHSISQSGVGRELIVSVSRTNANGGLTDAVLSAFEGYTSTAHGVDGAGDSAFTVGGLGTADGSALVNTATAIAGDTATETVYYRLQGTGDLTVADAQTAAGTNVTVAIVAVFQPRPIVVTA